MKHPQTIGERLAQARREKAAREQRDILAVEVAKHVGATAANYSRWEADERVPRENSLKKLAAYLGVTPAFLRYGVVEAEQVEARIVQPTVHREAPKSARKRSAS